MRTQTAINALVLSAQKTGWLECSATKRRSVKFYKHLERSRRQTERFYQYVSAQLEFANELLRRKS